MSRALFSASNENIMALALIAIIVVLIGLVVRQNGLDVAAQGPQAVREAGMQAAGVGALMALVAAPWLIIGFAAHIV